MTEGRRIVRRDETVTTDDLELGEAELERVEPAGEIPEDQQTEDWAAHGDQ